MDGARVGVGVAVSVGKGVDESVVGGVVEVGKRVSATVGKGVLAAAEGNTGVRKQAATGQVTTGLSECHGHVLTRIQTCNST